MINDERRAASPEDNWGRLCNPAWLVQPQRPILRTSHFPDPPTTTLRRPNQPLDKHRGTEEQRPLIHSAQDLDWIAAELNDRPRKRLGFNKPIEQIGPLLLR